MCGRYHVDDETAREIGKVIRQVNENIRQAAAGGLRIRADGSRPVGEAPAGDRCPAEELRIVAGDIYPAGEAPVLAGAGQGICCRWQRWGLPKPFGSGGGGQVIFNARSESALEKRMFREGVACRRIVIPAAWFYEWNPAKEKNSFCRIGQPVVYMAGFYNHDKGEDRFVILTTEANESVKPVHGRMPLVLEPEEIAAWICDSSRTEEFLHKKPGLLERRAEFQQMSLF